jgi:hypothetical protein
MCANKSIGADGVIMKCFNASPNIPTNIQKNSSLITLFVWLCIVPLQRITANKNFDFS